MTKPDKIDLILQLNLDICVLGTMKTLSYDPEKILGVVFDIFLFFGSSIAHLEPELQRFEDRSPFVGISANLSQRQGALMGLIVIMTICHRTVIRARSIQ